MVVTNLSEAFNLLDICLSRNRGYRLQGTCILNSQVVSLPLQSMIKVEVANFCAVMDTLVDEDGLHVTSSDI